jgi:hypothetical protein
VVVWIAVVAMLAGLSLSLSLPLGVWPVAMVAAGILATVLLIRYLSRSEPGRGSRAGD